MAIKMVEILLYPFVLPHDLRLKSLRLLGITLEVLKHDLDPKSLQLFGVMFGEKAK